MANSALVRSSCYFYPVLHQINRPENRNEVLFPQAPFGSSLPRSPLLFLAPQGDPRRVMPLGSKRVIVYRWVLIWIIPASFDWNAMIENLVFGDRLCPIGLGHTKIYSSMGVRDTTFLSSKIAQSTDPSSRISITLAMDPSRHSNTIPPSPLGTTH